MRRGWNHFCRSRAIQFNVRESADEKTSFNLKELLRAMISTDANPFP